MVPFEKQFFKQQNNSKPFQPLKNILDQLQLKYLNGRNHLENILNGSYCLKHCFWLAFKCFLNGFTRHFAIAVVVFKHRTLLGEVGIELAS